MIDIIRKILRFESTKKALNEMEDCYDRNVVLAVHIKNTRPIEVSDFTNTMKALGDSFCDFAQAHGKSREELNAKLYVSKITEGSIDIHFMDAVAATMIPLMQDFNLLIEFAKHVKDVFDYFLHPTGKERPELTVHELQNLKDILSVPSKDENGTMTMKVLEINNSTVLFEGCHFDYTQSNGLQNMIDREMKELKSASEQESYTRQLMTIYQIRKGEGTGNKAVIDAIHPKPLSLLFNSDALENEILHTIDNPMRKAYFVDVVLMTANKKPVAYKITSLHEKIDLE